MVFTTIQVFSQNTNIGGIINSYFPVRAINNTNCPAVVTIDDNETPIPDNLQINDLVLIIQMKGADISLLNDTTFGDIIDLNNAGNYEYAEIANIVGTDITLRSRLLYDYDAGAPGGYVQLIKVPRYIDATIISTLTGASWDQDLGTGGILALECSGTLTLDADIDVSGLGFEAGRDFNGGNDVDSRLNYIINMANNDYAYKGEGIVIYDDATNGGRGKYANGGGAGNGCNAGGAGGGNAGSGGDGGIEHRRISASTGGIGGVGFDYNILNRIYLGGGGGAGHANNGVVGSGGNGGGIIFIKSNAIEGNNFNILANGNFGNNQTIDGAGGGGSGGSILINIDNYGTTPFSINSFGGNGGNTTTFHNWASIGYGPGGGGGGGIIVSKNTLPPIITTNILPGVNGVSAAPPLTSPIDLITYGATPGDTGLIKIDTNLYHKSPNGCCFAATSPSYTKILNDLHITTNTNFIGQYYIAPNVIITVDPNVTLDITNVDMVFGQCAGIDVLDRATLRSNNSVYRTCDPSETWRGIRFINSVNNVIDECTFKNATFALDFGATSDGRVQNNLFSNCQHGIRLDWVTDFRSGIIGNTFTIDNDFPINKYRDNQCIRNDGQVYFIVSRVSTMKGNISQNHFINNWQNIDVPIITNGIGLLASNIVNISDNDFTDLTFGVNLNSIGRESELNIFNNTFSLGNHVEYISNTQIQINGFNNSTIKVYNNEIIAQDDYNTGSFSMHGINLLNTNNVILDNNKIQGFEAGIVVDRGSSTIDIVNNEISNPLFYGIYVIASEIINIHCNKIDMNFNDRISNGIYLDAVRGIIVHSNCIFDANTSLFIGNQFGNSDQMIIRNNYFYNYINSGINNDGCINLSIGNNTKDGQNTFYSNLHSAVDVNASVPTLCFNNFGLNVISWPNVSIVANRPIYSTASCANQIDGVLSQNSLDQSLECNPKLPGDRDWNEQKEQFNKLTNESEKTTIIWNHYSNLMLFNQSNALNFYDYVVENTLLNNNSMNLINYKKSLIDNNYLEAKLFLSRFIPTNSEEELLKITSMINIDRNLGIRDHNTLTTDEITTISLLSNIDENYVNKGRALLHIGGVPSKEFYVTPLKRAEASNSTTLLNTSDNSISVYPNPVSDMLNILLNTKEISKLNIYDILGQQVYTSDLNIVTGNLEINISNLSSGQYIVEVESTNNEKQVAKFIKQ